MVMMIPTVQIAMKTASSLGFTALRSMNISGVEVRRTTDGGENWSASAVTLPRGLPDDGTELLTAFAPYYASNQWVLPAFEEPDKLIYFTSQDQGATCLIVSDAVMMKRPLSWSGS